MEKVKFNKSGQWTLEKSDDPFGDLPDHRHVTADTEKNKNSFRTHHKNGITIGWNSDTVDSRGTPEEGRRSSHTVYDNSGIHEYNVEVDHDPKTGEHKISGIYDDDWDLVDDKTAARLTPHINEHVDHFKDKKSFTWQRPEEMQGKSPAKPKKVLN